MKRILIVLSIIILPFTSAFAGGHYSGPDLSGQKITISGPWLAPQDDQFRKVIKAFTDATGAVVEADEDQWRGQRQREKGADGNPDRASTVARRGDDGHAGGEATQRVSECILINHDGRSAAPPGLRAKISECALEYVARGSSGKPFQVSGDFSVNHQTGL